jgi:mannose-6-phosphate isomerase-like protein (cupin superfamily)
VSAGVRVLDSESGPELELVATGGIARAIVWPGMGAKLRSLHRIELRSGGETVPQRHPNDAVYYVAAGSGEAFGAAGADRQALREGSMVHIDAATPYVLRAGGGGMVLLGGPAPPDPALYEGVE